MTKMMLAARMHKVGAPMIVEEVERPTPGSTDVLVQVKACGMVPNLGNVLAKWPERCPHLPLPKLPATFGLDPTGVVTEVGRQVIGITPGDRVYVNPGRSCGSCEMCLRNERTRCRYFTLNGYFGYQPESQKIFEMYPFGGFCEYMTAPQYSIVKLVDNVTFEQGARLGYIGTGYGALKKIGQIAGTTLLVNGVSGTLGLGTTMCALAMGVAKIYGTGQNRALLNRIKALAPDRIETFSTSAGGSISQWIRARTNGIGADNMIDALAPAAPIEALKDAMHGVRRGGKIVNVGGTIGDLPIHVNWFMDEQLQFIGSVWLSTAEGYEIMALAQAGLVDFSILETEAYPLAEINTAIGGLQKRNGGFSNFVIRP